MEGERGLVGAWGGHKFSRKMWRELSQAERVAYTRGLKQEPSSGRGGLRVWTPAPPAKLATPPCRWDGLWSAAVAAAEVIATAAQPALTRLPTPPSAAVTVTLLAPGCAPAVSVAASVAASVCASVSAERTAKTAPPSPDPEDQPAAERRANPDGQGGGVNVEPNTTTRRCCSGFARRAPAAPASRNEQYRPREGLQG